MALQYRALFDRRDEKGRPRVTKKVKRQARKTEASSEAEVVAMVRNAVTEAQAPRRMEPAPRPRVIERTVPGTSPAEVAALRQRVSELEAAPKTKPITVARPAPRDPEPPKIPTPSWGSADVIRDREGYISAWEFDDGSVVHVERDSHGLINKVRRTRPGAPPVTEPAPTFHLDHDRGGETIRTRKTG